jgi:Tol biopolymer transport system component
MDSLTTRQLASSGNFPSWHPNDSEVVVMDAGQQIATSAHTIDAMNSATGQWRTLFSFNSQDDCGFGSISPGGGTYLFSGLPDKGLAQIWKVDLSTPALTRLTSDGADYPAWSPDGAMIVFTRTAEGDGTLWLMRTDGSGKKQLTSR